MKDEGGHLCSYREEHNICLFMESSLKNNYTAHNAIANACCNMIGCLSCDCDVACCHWLFTLC